MNNLRIGLIAGIVAELNKRLVAVQRMAADAIRSVDRNHVIMFAGGQWDTNHI